MFGLGAYGVIETFFSKDHAWIAAAMAAPIGVVFGAIGLRHQHVEFQRFAQDAGLVVVVDRKDGSLEFPRLQLRLAKSRVLGFDVLEGIVEGSETVEPTFEHVSQVLLVFADESGRVWRRLVYEGTRGDSFATLVKQLGYAVRTNTVPPCKSRVLSRRAPLSSGVYSWAVDGADGYFPTKFGITAASCPRCKYDLRALTTPRCPECGLNVRDDW